MKEEEEKKEEKEEVRWLWVVDCCRI